jgi:outer membrane protease
MQKMLALEGKYDVGFAKTPQMPEDVKALLYLQRLAMSRGTDEETMRKAMESAGLIKAMPRNAQKSKN